MFGLVFCTARELSACVQAAGKYLAGERKNQVLPEIQRRRVLEKGEGLGSRAQRGQDRGRWGRVLATSAGKSPASRSEASFVCFRLPQEVGRKIHSKECDGRRDWWEIRGVRKGCG